MHFVAAVASSPAAPGVRSWLTCREQERRMPMQRREFLVRLGGVLVAVPATLTAISCGGDDDDDGGGATDFTITSDGAAHTHKVTIKCTDLSSSSDVMYTSTTDAGHNHQF